MDENNNMNYECEPMGEPSYTPYHQEQPEEPKKPKKQKSVSAFTHCATL